MTIPRGNGVAGRGISGLRPEIPSENRRQLMRRNDLELVVGAVARFLVRAPSSELRGVTEPAALHVVVGDFDHQLGTQRFPGQILALAPAALGARHTTSGLTVFRSVLRPVFPGVSGQGVLTVRGEVFCKLEAPLFRDARADADVL